MIWREEETIRGPRRVEKKECAETRQDETSRERWPTDLIDWLILTRWLAADYN